MQLKKKGYDFCGFCAVKFMKLRNNGNPVSHSVPIANLASKPYKNTKSRSRIKTPNIDRLAEEGARLRHDLMPNGCVHQTGLHFLLEGIYPIRSGLASDEGQLRMFLSASASGGLLEMKDFIC